MGRIDLTNSLVYGNTQEVKLLNSADFRASACTKLDKIGPRNVIQLIIVLIIKYLLKWTIISSQGIKRDHRILTSLERG